MIQTFINFFDICLRLNITQTLNIYTPPHIAQPLHIVTAVGFWVFHFDNISKKRIENIFTLLLVKLNNTICN